MPWSSPRMSKRYAEPIEVEAPDGSIEAFWWRGKRYPIRRVITRWRETGGWWEQPESTQRWAAGRSLEFVRVDARRGVYELARDLRSGSWTLARVLD